MYKIIGADQQEYGPISAEQVRLWFMEGRLNGNSRIQNADSGEWKALREMAEFAELFPPSTTPPPITNDPFKTVFGQASTTNPTNTMAMWAFGTGLFTCLCCQILGPVSIVLGFMALAEIKQNPNQNGRGFAVAGIVLGCFALFLGFVSLVFWRFSHRPHAIHF